MWERRYQAVLPERTPTGRRIYTDQDVVRLNLLKNTLACGWRIGDIGARSNKELTDLITNHEQARFKRNDFTPRIAPTQDDDSDYLNKCLASVSSLDFSLLERLLASAENDMGFTEALDILVSPLLSEIGSRWENGEFKLAQEHMASATLRRYLDSVRTREKSVRKATTLLATTPSGQYHELGALMTTATAAASGWNSIYMNPNTPATDIAWAANAVKAKVVALSIVCPAKDALLSSELQHLNKLLPTDTHLVVGGTSADQFLASDLNNGNYLFLNSQGALKEFLRKTEENQG